MASPSSSSSSSSSKSPPPPQPSHFTPIQEHEEQEEESTPQKHHHNPTPLHANGMTRKSNKRDGAWVSCNKCRPNSREKNISVVPLDNNTTNNKSSFLSAGSPNGIFKSLISSLTRRSPKPPPEKEETHQHRQWKLAATELSQKLIQATRKRDEAILEASRLRRSTADLEKKLKNLERHCNSLRSGLNEFSSSAAAEISVSPYADEFLSAVSDSRSAVKTLARSMSSQLRHVGARVSNRLSALLRPYAGGENSAVCLEALLAGVFFEDFESPEFRRGGARRVLNPAARSESLRLAFSALRSLTWEEVLSRGTRHFSEEFSGFCDRKMSDIVGMLGWNRAWPEPLLRAFFAAAKATWLLHLLANSARPAVDLFRVEPGAEFDPGYMDDVADKSRRSVINIPSGVKVMVAPGFYVGNSVVKCKVLCRYNDATDNADSTVN